MIEQRREAAIAGPEQSPCKPTAADRLLTEAVRFHETAGGGVPAVSPEPGPPGMSPEARLTARARGLPIALELEAALARFTGLLRGVVLAGLLLAALGGAATARSAFAAAEEGTVNFYWLLASLLGLHALSLVAWLALILLLPGRGRGGALGATVIWLWQRACERLGAEGARSAAARALGARWGGAAGRWLASGLGHGLWFGFLTGGLIMTLALLSARHYRFVWETTILEQATYVALTEALAAIPAALGAAVPDQAAVIAAQWPTLGQTAGSAVAAPGQELLWSSLLISALLLYGLLPRALALAASLLLAWRAVAGARLDLGLPYYAQLLTRLRPLVGGSRVVDPDELGVPAPGPVPALDRLPPPPPAGPLFLLGWELAEPALGWPPPGTPAGLSDLGRCDGRDELARAMAALSAVTPGEVARLIVALDQRQSPDRGVTAVLAELEALVPGRLVVLLTGASALLGRLEGGDAGIRTADWVAAAAAAGVEQARLVAVDLDGPAEHCRRAMARLTDAAPAVASQ